MIHRSGLEQHWRKRSNPSVSVRAQLQRALQFACADLHRPAALAKSTRSRRSDTTEPNDSGTFSAVTEHGFVVSPRYTHHLPRSDISAGLGFTQDVQFGYDQDR